MIDWEGILLPTGVAGTVSAAIVIVFREWISTRIKKKIEYEYSVKEIRLKSELDGELEGVRAGYKKVLDENQIRFSRLYADQATAAKTLYRLIHQTHSKLTVFVSVLQSVPSNPEEQAAYIKKEHEDTVNAFNECNTFFQENRILLPEDICSQIDSFISITRKAYSDRFDQLAPWKEAETAMRGPALSLKRKLEARFRQLLGVLPAEGVDIKAVEMAAKEPDDANE